MAIVICAECGTRNPARGDLCGQCHKPLNGQWLPATPAPFGTRVKLMHVIIGMAKEAGYDVDRFILEVRTGWPHVK